MMALLLATLVALCLWLTAVVGTAMLRHSWERRTWVYQRRIPPSAVEPASVVWFFQLGRALAARSAWPMGFRYALELLMGVDAIEAMPESEVERTVRDAEQALRLASERMLRALADEQAEEFALLRRELEAEKAQRESLEDPSEE